ncbi:hypothetical protein ABE493_07795 [Stenotrophomonas terrae]|uniref:hypothetical protein n=1 Tax=Stenotrophomonas terrae TaxID=405446 RepID=UPI00320B55B1
MKQHHEMTLAQQLANWGRWQPPQGGLWGETEHDPVSARIERIVQRMEAQGRWKEAKVLRVEAAMGGRSEAERLLHLARVGVQLGRSAYYAYLKSAHAFIDGALPLEPLWTKVTVSQWHDDYTVERQMRSACCPHVLIEKCYPHELCIGPHFDDGSLSHVYCTCGWKCAGAASDEDALVAYNALVGFEVVPLSEWVRVDHVSRETLGDDDDDESPF